MKSRRIEESQQPLDFADFEPWSCDCSVVNFHAETHCRSCGALRPAQEPALLTNSRMEELVEKLKAEGRLPSLEKLLEAIADVRREYRQQILDAGEESASDE